VKKKEVKPLFEPLSGSHWSKRLPMDKRRNIVLRNHRGNYLKSAQAMDFLSKGTIDKKTKILARSDSDYFLKEHRRGKK
jgi:hypothetical protein